MSYKIYLQTVKGFTEVTAKRYLRDTEQFNNWLATEGLTIEGLSYQHMIGFIQARQKQGHGKRYINQGLVAVRHWLDYLVEEKRLDYNVANGLFIRGTGRKLPAGLLSREDLEGLYENYAVKDGRTLRNKVIVGLMVYQGLLVDELRKLCVSDLFWEKGQIRVPQARRANTRMLMMESVQVYHLQTYLAENALEKPDQKLFASFANERTATNTLSWLMGELKRINPLVKNATQIKMSLMSHWLQTRDLRIVQDMAGHRYVSSTERYQTSHLQSLQHDLERFHPLG